MEDVSRKVKWQSKTPHWQAERAIPVSILIATTSKLFLSGGILRSLSSLKM